MRPARNLIAPVAAALCALALAAPGVSHVTEAYEVSEDATAGATTSELTAPSGTTVGTTTGEPSVANGSTATRQVATQQEAVPIYDAAGLLAMADDPHGSYRLMADVDLSGTSWRPFAFYGTLEGDGHAILNASVSTATNETRTTYDGNKVEYATRFSGFFGTLEGATVRDVQFLGIDVDVQTDDPTFVGTVCGFMEDATIDGCTVVGKASLASTGHSIGVGGITGFGYGTVQGNKADVTLVCRDLDVDDKDEQFMGGAYAAGYVNLDGNVITLRGYDSDHGYVHNGGFGGMYEIYPEDMGQPGYVTNNEIHGTITFFEDNADRRAYCEPIIGEVMDPDGLVIDNNVEDFERDERYEYDTDLLPHDCASPAWSEEAVASTQTQHGYTLRTCQTCGYSEKVGWQPIAAATASSEPGTQALDGQAAAEATPTEQPQAAANQEAGIPWVPIIAGVVVLGVAVLVLLVFVVLR